MTSASQVAVLLAASLEAVGILVYVVATALVLRLAVRWARDAAEPPAAPGAPRSDPLARPPGRGAP